MGIIASDAGLTLPLPELTCCPLATATKSRIAAQKLRATVVAIRHLAQLVVVDYPTAGSKWRTAPKHDDKHEGTE